MSNQLWGQTLVKTLINQKVRYFCLAPGSRCTPLTVAIAEHPLTQTHVHYDERAIGFHALGYAKASGTPACIVVTSGTALGNLMPAVMEAYHERVPLVLLTADRPPELRSCGANQAADQVGLFGKFTRFAFDLPAPTADLDISFLESTVAHAVERSCLGPVHLNCMFREPFFSDGKSPNKKSVQSIKRTFYEGEPSLTDDSFEEIADRLSQYDKGLIVLGRMRHHYSLDAILNLARRLQWPILPDILSNARAHGKQPLMATHYDQIIKSHSQVKDLNPDAVLHLGHSFVSKSLLAFLEKASPKCYFHVHEGEEKVDPLGIVTDRAQMKPFAFARGLEQKLKGASPTPYLNMWQKLSAEMKSSINKFFDAKEDLTEMSLVRTLKEKCAEDTGFFLSNSMPVRDMDSLFFTDKKSGPIFCNRGLSGDDGNIATAIGVAEATKKPLIALLGDIAFLHDIGALASARRNLPITFLVVNNGGSGIFSFLPVSEKKEIFENYFATAHEYDFKAIAEQFHIQYFNPTTQSSLEETLLYSNPSGAPSIIEVTTIRKENHDLHMAFDKKLKGFNKKVKSEALYSYT